MDHRSVPLGRAVDLSSLASSARETHSASQGSTSQRRIESVAITQQNFAAEVVEKSSQLPVVVDFWADWCQPCHQLTPLLRKAHAADAGRWALATVDVDAEQQIAAAFGIQSLPTVVGVVGGQPVDAFAGALSEQQLREWLDQLFVHAEQAGLSTPAPQSEADAEEAPPDPDMMAARERLAERMGSYDAQTVREMAEKSPHDPDAALAVADLEVAAGKVSAAFERLLTVVGNTTGRERKKAQEHLLELFCAVGDTDEQVLSARRKLAALLF